jgi:hypothetical protein
MVRPTTNDKMAHNQQNQEIQCNPQQHQHYTTIDLYSPQPQQYYHHQQQQPVRVITCVRHKNTQAVTKCERCRKNLCLDCRSVFRENGDEGYGHIDLCGKCKKDKEEARSNRKMITAVILLLFIFVGIGVALAVTLPIIRR